MTDIQTVFGVDFSGARLAGRTTWLARLTPHGRSLRLDELHRVGRLCGSDERADVMAALVSAISASSAALWAINFPFGFPVEVISEGPRWLDQLAFIDAWGDDAWGSSHELLRRARALGGPAHIRRLTDVREQTPFDAYHYRIIYQTFHGMRDVLRQLIPLRRTAILPFQHRRLAAAERVVVEACPSSTLLRLGLPRVNYKQAEGGPLSSKRRRTRRAILDGLGGRVTIAAGDRLRMMRDGGADALDAVLCGVGAWRCWREYDHAALGRHPRYSREGCHYA